MFVKLFGPSEDQVLVTLMPTENRSPCLAVYKQTGRGREIYRRYLLWDPDVEGWQSAEVHFDAIDEDAARRFLVDMDYMIASEIYG